MSWILTSFKLPSESKYMLEDMSHELGITQSELIRRALDQYFQDHLEPGDDLEAVKIMARQRKERLGLLRPKDTFKTEMQIASAWDTIVKMKGKYRTMGVLGPDNYDAWIDRLQGNIDAIDPDNPMLDTMTRVANDLISELKAEKDRMFG
ncbi:MAG: ribbon-helix-helix domain-containing protein [Chitinivibrionales bacterium]|nr:ribbon-helix-helix domain-containing protein [Chitinivibrionales bacterium]